MYVDLLLSFHQSGHLRILMISESELTEQRPRIVIQDHCLCIGGV